MAAVSANLANSTRVLRLFTKKVPPLSSICRNYSSEVKVEEKETHTGQQWEQNDYRLVRFIDRPKQINESFAVNLIDELPPKVVKDRIVFCDGGGPLGHPKVYINLDKPGNHTCGYCGIRFVKDTEHH